jgi:ectoine hydroxylase-related dioxygenase (phytanoyl-CoA dioxygenase family)
MLLNRTQLLSEAKRKWPLVKELVEKSGGAQAPELAVGDVLFYDSRVLHRGLANQSNTNQRPVLIYRYDDVDTMPPGHGLVTTAVFRALGNKLGGE